MTFPICITGGSGFIGRHLIDRLLLENQEAVRVLTRQSRVHERIRFLRGDLLDRQSLRALVEPGSVVVHLAYAAGLDNVAAARNLAEVAVERGASKFVHVSTAVVVGRSRAVSIDESAPCRPATPYQREKLTIEEVVRQSLNARVPLTILRPTAVFGPGGKNLLTLALHLTSESKARVALRMTIMGRREMNLVAVENVVAAVIRCMTACPEGPFIVSDDQAANDYGHVARLLMEGLNMKPVSPVVDLSLFLSPLLRLAGRELSNPRTRFSAGRLRATGYRPVVDFDQAVRAFGAWYRTHSQSA